MKPGLNAQGRKVSMTPCLQSGWLPKPSLKLPFIPLAKAWNPDNPKAKMRDLLLLLLPWLAKNSHSFFLLFLLMTFIKKYTPLSGILQNHEISDFREEWFLEWVALKDMKGDRQMDSCIQLTMFTLVFKVLKLRSIQNPNLMQPTHENPHFLDSAYRCQTFPKSSNLTILKRKFWRGAEVPYLFLQPVPC